jgi:hypothetical protein
MRKTGRIKPHIFWAMNKREATVWSISADTSIFTKRKPTRGWTCLLLLLTLVISYDLQNGYASEKQVLFLTRLSQPLSQEWQHKKFVNETRYRLVREEGKPALQAVGQWSSSGLYKKIDYSLKEYPWLEWEWKLEKAHKTADLRIREKEDMALGIFVIFSPSWLMPWKTKTVAYVWTGANHRPGQIVSGPDHPYFILEAGEEKKGRWMTKQRSRWSHFMVQSGP